MNKDTFKKQINQAREYAHKAQKLQSEILKEVEKECQKNPTEIIINIEDEGYAESDNMEEAITLYIFEDENDLDAMWNKILDYKRK